MMRGGHTSSSPSIPLIPKELLRYLQEGHPPRCYTAIGESIEQHLRYAGKVELIATLAAHAQQQAEEDPIQRHAAEQMAMLDLEDDPEIAHTAYLKHQLEG